MKARQVLSVLLLASVIFFGFIGKGAAVQEEYPEVQPTGNPAALHKVLISFRSSPGAEDETLVRSHKGAVRYRYSLVRAMAATIPEAAVHALLRNPRVRRIEPDGLVHAIDVELDNAWGVARIGAGAVHDTGIDGAGVKVAVIDSGIDYNHPELAANYAGGYDFVYADDDPMDYYGHGTHVAGAIAAEDNGSGVVGVAPAARLYALRVLDASGYGNWSDVIAALEWVVSHGIQVTNSSLGSSSNPGAAVEEAFYNAYAAGVLNVAAAGNDGRRSGFGDSVDYPARFDSVIAVGATDWYDERASFSSTGPDLELAAPGVDIYSTWPGGGYATWNGTSMASPHVAGTAALVIAAGIADSNGDGHVNDEVRQVLVETALDLGAGGWDPLYGFGLVDALVAVEAANGGTPPPDPDNTPPVAVDDEALTTENMPVTIDVLANDTDADGDPLTVANVNYSGAGLVVVNADNTVTYTPEASFTGTDSFTYTVNDGTVDGNTATVTITVNPAVNNPPVAVDDEAVTGENTPVVIDVLANDTDADGDPLMVSDVFYSGTGSVTVNADDTVTYTPAQGFSGTDSFSYTASDGLVNSNVATVIITVSTAGNLPPTAVDDNASTTMNTPVFINMVANDYDADGIVEPNSVAIVSSPTRRGTVEIVTDGVIYTPRKNFRGTDEFTYTVDDDLGATSNVATVTVSVVR